MDNDILNLLRISNKKYTIRGLMAELDSSKRQVSEVVWSLVEQGLISFDDDYCLYLL